MTTDSDVLRWMAQANGDEKKKPDKKKKFKLEIRSWVGRAKEGEWVRESVATTLKRTFERHTHSAKSTKDRPEIVRVKVDELIYANDGYRPHFEDEKDTRKSFFWRGARIWRK